jgi:hypothetical protein
MSVVDLVELLSDALSWAVWIVPDSPADRFIGAIETSRFRFTSTQPATKHGVHLKSSNLAQVQAR